MTERRNFTAKLKAQVVLEVLSGAKSIAEACREYQLSSQVLGRWKAQFLEQAPALFARDAARSAEEQRIAELERLIGRLTVELAVAKKASSILTSASRRSGK
jgi:transposase-like protein